MRSLSSYLKIAAAVAALFVSGCSEGDGGRVPVTGTVTLDGTPLNGGTVAFIGGGGGALATASTDKDGKFRALVAPGPNRVTISKEDVTPMRTVAVPDDQMLMGTDAEYKAQQKAKPKDLVPPKYGNAETSGLSFDIVSGMEPLSISISSK